MSDRLLIAATLSLMAACVHAGMAPVHPGPQAAGFVGAAALQTAWTIAAVRGGVRGLAPAGVALNLGLIGVWLASRLSGAEPVQALDLSVVVAELAVCGLLGARAQRATEGAGLAAGAALLCLLVSGMAGHG